MFRKPIDASQLFPGLTPQDYEEERKVSLYVDNVPAINLFSSLITQWRVGMAGAYGLDYNVLYHKMDRMGLTPDQYLELESHVRVCEEGALQQMAQNVEETKAQPRRR